MRTLRSRIKRIAECKIITKATKAKPKVEAKAENKVNAKRAKGKARTELRCLVNAGVVPKARTCYALFLSDFIKVYGSVKSTAAAWAKAEEHVRQAYRIRAGQEASAQREAKSDLGLRNHGSVRELRYYQPVATIHKAVDDEVKGGDACLVSLGNYHIDITCAILGEGSYGTVMQAIDGGTGRVLAAKIFNGRSGVQSSRREREVYTALESISWKSARRLFLPLIEFQTSQATAWMVVPYVPSGSLAKQIRAHGVLKASDLDTCGIQLRDGLSYLHEVGFLHLDIKPQNILWLPQTRELLLVDFGMAEPVNRSLRSDMYDTYVTEPYRPPELWSVDVSNLNLFLTKAVDYWSYGCVVFEACCGKPLFPTRHCQRALEAYSRKYTLCQRCPFEPCARAALGEWALRLEKCLVPGNPGKRYIPHFDWKQIAY